MILVLSTSLVFAEGNYIYGTGTLTTTKDTLRLMRVDISPYRDMAWYFVLSECDTLRDDSLYLSIQTSKDTTDANFLTVKSFAVYEDADTITLQTHFPFDSLICPDTSKGFWFKKYARFYLTIGDHTGYTDAETLRPDADDTDCKDWSASTSTDHSNLIDEAAMDSTDYIYVTAADSFDARTYTDHAAVELTVDSVRYFQVAQHIPVTSETIRPTSTSINATWEINNSTAHGAIDEASKDTADNIFSSGIDTVVVFGMGNPASEGTATIDSANFVFLALAYADTCSLMVGICVTNAAGCDSCDCYFDTIAVTASDTTRYSYSVATSPRGNAWASNDADSMTTYVRTIAQAGDSVKIFQAYVTLYYTTTASMKYAVCLGDTLPARCTWGDSTALSAVIDTYYTTFAVNPYGSAFNVFQLDSLVGQIKSQHIQNGYIRVLQEYMDVFYNAGDLSPQPTYEVGAVLKE